MRKLVDSDFFKTEINKNNVILGKINMLLAKQIPGAMILNDAIFSDLKKKILNRHKDRITNAYMNAIQNYEIILFTVPPEHRIPEFLPFIRYKRDGVEEVAVNLSNHVLEIKNDNGQTEYDISDHVNTINILLRSAYLALTTLDPNEGLSTDTLYYSAVLWADMFNKPLFNAIGFHDRQKNDAFTYFAMKFFLLYMMGCPEKQIDSIISKAIPEKNSLILFMEDQIEKRGLTPFNGLKNFLTTLFNNEVTSMKGIKINGMNTKMNVSFYIQKFSQLYSSNAFLALCSYPYFVFVIFAATAKCGLVKDKSFDRMFNDKKAMRDRLLVCLDKV